MYLFDKELRLFPSGGTRSHDSGEPSQRPEGMALDEVIPPDAFALLAPACRSALTGELRAFDVDSPDGAVTHLIETGPLHDPHEQIIGGVVISRDVTDRRHAERLLTERASELERSNAELEQFAFVASHDLSEPLRMVSGHVELLGRRYRGQIDADADELIRSAIDGVARMRRLIDDLLTYSHAGRIDAPFTPVALQALAERAADRLRSPAAAGAVITIGSLPTLPGDAQGLGQVFDNLIGNAVKYVPEGRGARVEVVAERTGGMWLIMVLDDGIGIAAGHADQIFRMFERLHSEDDYPGTGIGLAIARKVVVRHGGRIWAEPRAEGGSRFCFTLPAA